jgi:hypothetical protein
MWVHDELVRVRARQYRLLDAWMRPAVLIAGMCSRLPGWQPAEWYIFRALCCDMLVVNNGLPCFGHATCSASCTHRHYLCLEYVCSLVQHHLQLTVIA